jgi:N5-(cytidine 5'-diphosphoramidyl)-L-glutamine hydrolase
MKNILISQRRDIIDGRDEARDALDTRWANILFDLGLLPIPICSVLTGTSNYIEQLKPDGILLSGGNDLGQAPERDLLEKKMLDYARDNNLPVLGVCRGMQMLNNYLGGRLVEVKGHVATHHLLEGEWAKKKGYKQVNSYHNQAITAETLAKSLEILSITGDGVIEAVKHTTLPWLGIMWHPERDSPVAENDKSLILKQFGGV